MQAIDAAVLDLTQVAAAPGPLPARAADLLEQLNRAVPFDSAWLAHVDTLLGRYSTVSSRDLDSRSLDCLAGPAGANDVDAAGVNRPRAPLAVADLPFPVQELETWSECLLPTGYHEALAVALYSSDHRHVGLLALLYEGRHPPPTRTRRLLHRLTPLLADAIDPMRSMLPAARLVQGAAAGVVLRRDGDTQELPGLVGHELLQPGHDVLRLADQALAEKRLHTAFLWPIGGDHAPQGHRQVTVLAATDDAPAIVSGMVLVSPPPDLRGLTPRELQILGLLVEGQTNAEIAHAFTVAPRTVAAHVEHILHKLDASSRTLAAVRAEREGLHVPAVPRGRRPARRGGESARRG